MYPDIGDLMLSKTNHSRAVFIDEDLSLNEEVKVNAFMGYMRNGNHHPSMTKSSRRQSSIDWTLFKIFKSSSGPFVWNSIWCSSSYTQNARDVTRYFQSKHSCFQQTCCRSWLYQRYWNENSFKIKWTPCSKAHPSTTCITTSIKSCFRSISRIWYN